MRQDLLQILKEEKNFVFLDNQIVDAENKFSFLFASPREIITTNKISQVSNCLRKIDYLRKRKFYIAGFLGYEAGEAFESKLAASKIYDFPLVWFGAYKKPIVFKDKLFYKNNPDNYYLKDMHNSVSYAQYRKSVYEIKNYISRGLTYQINLTFKIKFDIIGSVIDLYFSLRDAQKTSYSALVNFGGSHILSFSPELFFRKVGGDIFTRPMKGTLGRGKDKFLDRANISFLRKSTKDRSENIMIVDLLRNDLGRIAKIGSVSAKPLFEVKKLRTLLQMTSTVRASVDKDIPFLKLAASLFPSGSVTGAPKISSMGIIKRLEQEPRNIYTGSIGFIKPNNDSCFNVAIRTVLVDGKSLKAELGVGSGVVFDSSQVKEYKECLLKAKFLYPAIENDFCLIETILFENKRGYFLLDLHLSRLFCSAKYFSFAIDKNKLIDKLDKLAQDFKKDKHDFRIRIVYAKRGSFNISFDKIKQDALAVNYVKFGKCNTDSKNVFLRHKTTKRDMYELGLAEARRKKLFDFLYQNERGEVTESSIANIFIMKKGCLFTPPVKCGLLNGVFREYLLKAPLLRGKIKEKVLYPVDLASADEVYLVNSVRKIIKVKLLT